MLVTELKVSGYKTLRDVVWHPGRLNVVIGPNASGKSNLLRLLKLVGDSARGDLYDRIISDGGIGALLWNGHSKLIDLSVVVSEDQTGKQLEYGLKIRRLGDGASYAIEEELLDEHGFSPPLLLTRGKEDASFMLPDRQYESWGEINPTSTLLSEVRGSIHPRLRDFVRLLAAWNVADDYYTSKSAPIRRPVVARHDESLDSDGQNLASVLHTYYENDTEFHENIDRAMTAAFGDEYKSLAFPPAGSQNIELCVRWRSIKRPQPASTLSDGTLRFLFLITALSLPKPPALITIDEPETGLHPSMFPIVAEYAENASLKSQVILTTHSTQFLDAFRDKAPTLTVTKLVDGETKLATLDDEHLNYWLKDYTLGSLFRSGELENMGTDIIEQEHADDMDDEKTVIAPASHQAE